MKPWILDKDGPAPEGKYLVVRRDGTVPPWPHFVLSADDPATPAALRAYADVTARRMSARLHMDDGKAIAEYAAGVRELAHLYEVRQAEAAGYPQRLQAIDPQPKPKCDPEAGPHRKDNPAVVAMMRGEGDLRDYAGPGAESRKEDRLRIAYLEAIISQVADVLESSPARRSDVSVSAAYGLVQHVHPTAPPTPHDAEPVSDLVTLAAKLAFLIASLAQEAGTAAYADGQMTADTKTRIVALCDRAYREAYNAIWLR